MNTFLWIIVVYLAGWAISIPFMLRSIMENEYCRTCLKTEFDHKERDKYSLPKWRPDNYHRYQGAPLGTLRERTGKDAAAAIGLAICWPVISMALVVMTLAFLVKKLILKMTPLTEGEREFKAAKRVEDIERLTKEIGI